MSRPGSKKTNHNKARTTATSSSGSSSFHQRFQAFRRRTKLSVGAKQQQEKYLNDDVTAEFFSFRSDDDDPLESSTTTSSSSSSASSSRPVHSILKTQHSVRRQAEEDDHDIHAESSLEHKRERRPKSVRFSHIRQSYHASILGDHPLPEEGPPLTLSWDAFYHETIPIQNEEEDESLRQRTRHTSMSSPPSLDLLSALQAEQDRRRHAKTPRRWSADERTNIVMSEGGKHHAQRAAMARVQRESRRIRRSREHEWMRYLVYQQEQENKAAQQCRHADLEHDARLDLLLM